MSYEQQKQKNWEQFIQYLKEHLEKDEIDAWVSKLSLIHCQSDEIVISGPNQFFCNWIRDHHRDLVREGLMHSFWEIGLITGFKLVLKVAEEGSNTPPPQTQNDSEYKNQSATAARPQIASIHDGLNPDFSFEKFVSGDNSNIAYAAAQSVADNLEQTNYNPLFVYGDVGLGKTHLIQAIGVEIKRKAPDKKILYTTTQKFTNEFIDGIRFHKTHQIRNKYRSLDLLLIDDIQFLEGKETTQEEFFHTFNELIQNNKQVVITSDRYPSEIKNIEERLVSRFASGMLTKIELPDFETRVAITRTIVESLNIPIDDEITNLIASTVKSNVRDLRGILINLEAESSLMEQKITPSRVRVLLRERLNIEDKPSSVNDIIRTVAAKFDVKVSDIKSEKRGRSISQARQVAMYIVRELTNMSFPTIGKNFGGKNHSSVVQACKKIKALMQKDPEMKQRLKSIMRSLRN
ncbi:MAG: chromosomal replication initiator protein [bacterium]|jgi:chromosomal replication initiator protein